MNFEPIIIIDPGHGGLTPFGRYDTHPDRRAEYKSENHKPRENTQINEGVLNRAVAYLLSFVLDFRYIDNYVLPSNRDDSLKLRCQTANEIHKKRPNALYLSIHHNGFSDPDVSGFELFTNKGRKEKYNELTKASDDVAQLIGKHYKNQYGHRFMRTPGTTLTNGEVMDEPQYFKKKSFYVLRCTTMPAILTEWGFMTNPQEYDYISNPRKGIMDQVYFLDFCIRDAIEKKLFLL